MKFAVIKRDSLLVKKRLNSLLIVMLGVMLYPHLKYDKLFQLEEL